MRRLGPPLALPSGSWRTVLSPLSHWNCSFESLVRHRLLADMALSPFRLRVQQSSPEFTGVAVTVAVNRDANGEAGSKSYSKTGGECGIRTRGGGFADLRPKFTRVRTPSIAPQPWGRTESLPCKSRHGLPGLRFADMRATCAVRIALGCGVHSSAAPITADDCCHHQSRAALHRVHIRAA